MFTTAFVLNPYLLKIKKEKHNTDTSGDINTIVQSKTRKQKSYNVTMTH